MEPLPLHQGGRFLRGKRSFGKCVYSLYVVYCVYRLEKVEVKMSIVSIVSTPTAPLLRQL